MKVLTDNQYYGQIANVIREQNGTNNTYTPPQMVSALKDLFYEEVEGVPPITFQGIGENLLDYRIDGASGEVGERTKNLCPYNKANNSIIAHVESGKTYSFSLFASFLIGFNLMKRNASSQSTSSVAIKYNSEGNVSATFTADEDFDLFVNGFSSISGKTFLESVSNFQLEESSTVTDYEPYGYKVPVAINGKNLFDELQVVDKTVSSESSNFQIFKQNEKLIINGLTTNSQADVEIANINSINNQALQFINSNKAQYIFSAEVPGRIMIRYKLLGSDVVRYTFDEYNSSNKVADRIVFRLQQNYQYNNEQMNIMFKLKQIQLADYEAYHEPTTTNIYLDEPLEENESISLSDTNVNIPTIRGTNVLSIDTTVQPSNVYVKARKESSYEIAMRERYEEAQSQLDALENGGE